MSVDWTRRDLVLSLGASVIQARFRSRHQAPEIDRMIEAAMKAKPTPGLAIAVIESGELAWSKGYGMADRERRVPMTPDTVLNVGSVTKTVTATAIMQLVERGRLALDADVDQVLPFSVRNPAHPSDPITVRQLLTHTSSIKDGADYLASYACGDPAERLALWVEKYLTSARDRPRADPHFSTARPGAAWDYSNVGFGLLGVIIETVSGLSYADYTVRNLFEPLGMLGTGWYLGTGNQHRHAVPYAYVERGIAALSKGRLDFSRLQAADWNPGEHHAPTFVPHCLYSFPTLPDGLMRTSVNDLARFIGAYRTGGARGSVRILESRTVEAIWTPQKIGTGQRRVPAAQGLAWYRAKADDTAWQHGGGDPGIATFVAVEPAGRGVAVICNSDASDPEGVARQVLGRR